MENQQNRYLTHKPTELPAIPDKRYFTIGEVAELCAVKPPVLRDWEETFSMLNPMKRRGNRRYYQLKDLLLIRKIRALVYDRGLSTEETLEVLSSEISLAREQNTLIRHTIAQLENLLADVE